MLSVVSACHIAQAAAFVVKELAGVAKAKKLKGFERIASAHLTTEPFSTDNGFMTPSMKLKRCGSLFRPPRTRPGPCLHHR